MEFVGQAIFAGQELKTKKDGTTYAVVRFLSQDGNVFSTIHATMVGLAQLCKVKVFVKITQGQYPRYDLLRVEEIK